jgi:hypothetical protein
MPKFTNENNIPITALVHHLKSISDALDQLPHEQHTHPEDLVDRDYGGVTDPDQDDFHGNMGRYQ